MDEFDVVVIGAGAAGMMCAVEAGRRGRRVLVIDHAAAPGEKIRISGGGRCNFTNLEADKPDRFLSDNPGFCISALRRYTPQDFIAWIERQGVAWHEKTLGQLFCDGSARQIVDMLTTEMIDAGVILRLGVSVGAIAKADDGFGLTIGGETVACASLVIATGGKSIPKMGATGFGYRDRRAVRARGGHRDASRPRVPLTFETGAPGTPEAPLAGVALDVCVSVAARRRFEEAMLFTHRGLSGPAILQISSYWREGEASLRSTWRRAAVFDALRRARAEQGRANRRWSPCWPRTGIPRRLAELVAADAGRRRRHRRRLGQDAPAGGRRGRTPGGSSRWARRATAPRR